MIAGILLAAGRGGRFGSTKQLAIMPNGRTMLATSASNLRVAVSQMVIVVSGDAALQEHASVIAREIDCQIAINPRADEGMGTSIACGVSGILNADGWLIALADMPFIQSSTIASVAETLKKNRGVVVPTYLGARGHPVGFDREFMHELRGLEGDTGARALINAHSAQLTMLAVEDAGVLRDVDTRSDIAG
jgi:molybdenum cofactor cytidylyltransferase